MENLFNDQKIQLLTSNQFGEFYFYISQDRLKEYLEINRYKETLEDFVEEYTLAESKNIYDWLRVATRPQVKDKKVSNTKTNGWDLPLKISN